MRDRFRKVLGGMLLVTLILSSTNTAVYAQSKSSYLTIDGSYEDWRSIPHGILTYGSWNGQCNHQAALHVQDGYLYGHIEMHDLYGTQVRMNSMTISVNGRATYQFTIHVTGENGSIDWSKDSIVYNLPVGITTGLGAFTDGWPVYYLGEAAATVYSGDHKPGDEFEFRISLQTLSQMTNIPIESMSTFTLTAVNVGGGSITTAGTSTGTVVGIMLCTTTIGLVFLRKKRRERESLA